MEIKKLYLTPVAQEGYIRIDTSFLASESSGTLEGGNVLDYDDDFWS